MKLFDVYPLYDIEPVKGYGSYVYTSDGTQYLDLYGGHAVISIGHSHPHYVKAISEQVQNLGFYSNSVKNGLQEKLAEKIGKISGYDDYNLFLCNSGAEANENAMKVAAFTTGRKKILAFEGAFHGRTAAAAAATHNPKIRSPFNMAGKVDFIPLNDTDKLSEALQSKEYAAAIIEPIQGVGGIRMAADSFMQHLEKECHNYGTLLIIDEIQTGVGRSGKFFAHSYAGIRPDIITMAKGIANGLPMGAVLISPKISASHGMLGTTFGGNHLACAAAIAVLDTIDEERLVKNAEEVGNYLIEELRKIPEVEEVRGRGLMIGFEVKGWKGGDLRKKLLFDGQIFTGGAGERTLRLLPALSLTKQLADKFLDTLKMIIRK